MDSSNKVEEEPAAFLERKGSVVPSVKPGPLATPPPSPEEWKARGEKGEPPLPFEKVVRNTPSGEALEYLIYHGFVSQVKPRELERRIHELEEDRSRKNVKYNKAALYYLKKKLEELIVGGDN